MKTTQPFQFHSSITAAALALAVPVLSLLLASSLHAASQKFTSSGTFTPAAGITSVTVECWGGGGAGGSAQTTAVVITAGGGAGGGAYAKKVNIPVTPGTPYTVTIPAAAASLASGFATGDRVNGADITFTGDGGVSVTANGGQGGACAVEIAGATSRLGAGGTAGSGLDTAWAGGSGQSTNNGGVGGSAASDLSNGSQGTTATKLGSDADHNGGGGGTGVSGTNNGGAGGVPGGGGGGGRTQSVGLKRGGAGGKGQIVITYSGGTVTKVDNADDLNLGTSWVGGNAPDSSGTAKWDNTMQSANTTILGADLTWGGITIANPAGLVTIGAGNTLTLNGGIDMSSADAAGLTLNCPLALGGSAVWNVAANRTLTLGGIVSGSFNVTEQGAGKVVLSAANTYSGATAITGGTLQLGASGVIPDGAGKGNVSVAASCSVDLNAFSETINGLSGAGIVDNTAASTASTLTVGGNNADSTFSGVMQNSGSDSTLNLIKTGSGTLTLSGVNTFTGTATVNGGNLTLANANPLGNISGLTIGGAQLGCSASNGVIPAPITLTGNLTVIVQSSGVLTSLNGVISGIGNISFSTGNNTLNGDNRVSLGAAGDFTGNVTITTTTSQITNNMTVRLGAVNALPTTAVVTLDGQNGNGNSWADLNLFGFDQTLAGLKNISRTSRLQRVYNSSATAATITISNTTDYSFGGTLGKASGNNFGLTKSGSGLFTLSAANTYTGATKVSGGILSLGHRQSLQNSTLDTLNSIAGDLTNGLQTTVTSLTLGGLTGNKDLAAMFETTAGGYSGVADVTLNPGTGATPGYSGIIADGAAGMTLTKTGVGTQTLSGVNSYTGATTVSAGTLALGESNVLPDTTAVAIGSATLSIGAGFADTIGTLDATSTASINLGPGATLAFADSSGIDWTGGTLSLTGTFVSGASLRFGTTSGGLKPEQLALLSATGFGSFALDANGFLTASVAGGYTTWATTHAPTGTAAADFDGDGVSNGAEYVLGGTKNTNDLGKLPKLSSVGGNLVFTFTRDQASIDGSTTVAIEVGIDLATWTTPPSPYAVPAGATGPVSSGVTVVKDTSPGFDTVTLTIPQAPDLKKFARIKVTVTP